MGPACVEQLMESQLAPAATRSTAGLRLLVGDLNGCTPEALKVAEQVGLRSAYSETDEAMAAGGPVVTAHNDEYHWCGELDFVWYVVDESAKWRACGVAQIPAKERLCTTRTFSHPTESLPNVDWPSDHISLIVDFVPI